MTVNAAGFKLLGVQLFPLELPSLFKSPSTGCVVKRYFMQRTDF